jgi:hypothetical protein
LVDKVNQREDACDSQQVRGIPRRITTFPMPLPAMVAVLADDNPKKGE